MGTVRKILLVASVIVIGLNAYAQTDYERVEAKSKRFFENKEWASAIAMYILMLEQQPKAADTYAHAAVAYTMTGDTINAVELVPRSMAYAVPLDSLLENVRRVSFSIGRGDLYEDYLHEIKSTYPWLSRVADNYLMKYYAFRQNGPELIRYARVMLSGLPDSREFLRMLAHGLLLTGDTRGAIGAWLKVTDIYPDDYDTTLDLANCYAALGDKTEALSWMKRALDLRSTPYVLSQIQKLSK